MQKFIASADVITPNMTELCYLLDIPYQEHFTDKELKKCLKQLSDKGPGIVVITSVPVPEDQHKTSSDAYNREGNKYWKITCS